MAVKQALDTLREIRDGAFLDDLSVEINDLVREVQRTDKKGKLTITLDFEPFQNDATRIIVKDTFKVAKPTLNHATLFYSTPEANLQRRDPRQPEISFPRPADEPSTDDNQGSESA